MPIQAKPKTPSKAKPIPEGFHTITPYLVVHDAKKAIQFYKDAFLAKEIDRNEKFGKIMHAIIKIGDSMVMLSDEFQGEGCKTKSPSSLKGTTGMLNIYVEDVDTFFERAKKAGAKVTMPVGDMFWGDRYGQLEDPFGHLWSIATHKQDLSKEEIEEAANAFFKNSKKMS